MFVDLVNQRVKRRAWKRFNKLLIKFERSFFKRMKRFLNGQYNRVAAAEGEGMPGAYHLIDKDLDKLGIILFSSYKRIFRANRCDCLG